ncbi:MAG: histidine kinase, partial [Ignavibacteriales bacterium]|nr:histidine kinase [Ignavibacteriales bacterium]
YSVTPRTFFVFDPAKNTIIQSGESFAALKESFAFRIDNKKEPDFACTSDATGNSDTSAPFSDMYAWLMIFTKDAAFRNKPVKIGNYPSWSLTVPLRREDEMYIVTANGYSGTEKHGCTLSLFTSALEKVGEVKFLYSEAWKRPILYYDTLDKPDFFWIIKRDGSVEKRNSDFVVLEKYNIPPLASADYSALDLDGDGKDELIFQSEDHNSIIITRNDFSSYVLVNSGETGELLSCSVKLNGGNPPELFALFSDAGFTILYTSNSFYFLKYPLYGGIYLFVLSIVLLIQKAQQHRAELKYETEKRIAELQLKSIKNQVDPHFTLNIINSIGSLSYKQDKEKADYIFSKYSKLLRSTILNSDKIVTTLSDELEYVDNYLELEKFRLNNRFVWDIKKDEKVNVGISIPKMLIHTFVENAVKHGLKDLEGSGNLLILISNSHSEQTILVSDNGIGREKAKKYSQGNTGKGLHILDQILNLYYDLMKVRITYTIEDVIDNNGLSGGTKVLIKIPMA